MAEFMERSPVPVDRLEIGLRRRNLDILAVPARRYAELVDTFRGLAFDEDRLAESTFTGHRLIVAQSDPPGSRRFRDRGHNSARKTLVRWAKSGDLAVKPSTIWGMLA